MTPDEATGLVQAALLGEAVDAGPALVFVADEDRRYVAVNRTACEALGYTREELLDLSVTDVAVADEASGLYQAMLRAREAAGVTPIRTKDGRTLSLRYRAAEVTVAHMTLYVSVGFVEDDG